MVELAELPRGLAESLVERARREGPRLTGEGGLLTGLVKMVLESALAAETAEHLGYERGDPVGAGSGNARNGTSRKRLLTEVGPVDLEIPRDRADRFEPHIVARHSRRAVGFDAAVLSLHARA